MAREARAGLVQLPRLSAAEALVLATEMLTEADTHGAGKPGRTVAGELLSALYQATLSLQWPSAPFL